MTIRGEDLLDAAEIIAQQKDFKVALKSSGAAGVFGGITMTICGLFMGPIGLLVGGVGGGALSFMALNGRFKSVAQIIKEDLTAAQRNLLIDHLRSALKDFDLTDLAKLSLLIASNVNLQNSMANVVKEFVENQLQLKLQ